MSAVLTQMGPRLSRAIIVRQVHTDGWRVEGYERFAGLWRFTWVLRPEENRAEARQYAAWLARNTGLPVGEHLLDGRISLIDGVLGKAA